MRPLLDFDDAGATDDEPAKGVLVGHIREWYDELERLQRIIDSRPAINAGLPESYIKWSQSIYELEFVRATGAQS